MRYIDTHSHPHFPHYDADREAILTRMRSAGVATIAVGTSVETSRRAVAFAALHPDIWATIGVHPNDTKEIFDATVFESMLSPKVVAIGECGLDYFRTTDALEFKRQRENFEAQIAFAAAHKIPLMLHVRPGKGSEDAHNDAVDILRAARWSLGGTSHFFTGSLETARKYWDIGLATSFPGVITFAPETHEVVQGVPDELMLSETDAPYAAPMPHRGQRNEPSYVVSVVEAIADIRREDREAVRLQLLENAKRIFRLAL